LPLTCAEFGNLIQLITAQILNYAHGGKERLERAIACFAISVEAEKAKNGVVHGGKKQPVLQSFKWIAAAICMQEVAKIQRLPKSLKTLLASSVQG